MKNVIMTLNARNDFLSSTFAIRADASYRGVELMRIVLWVDAHLMVIVIPVNMKPGIARTRFVISKAALLNAN